MADNDLLGRFRDVSESMAARLAEELLSNPTMMNALAKAMNAKSRLDDASQSAFSAVNLTSARDFDDLKSKVRVLSTRLEKVEAELERTRSAPTAPARRTATKRTASTAKKASTARSKRQT